MSKLMSRLSVVQRGISRVWRVTVRPGMGPHKKVGQVLQGSWQELDPFLFMAEDWFQQGTFDFHPHRGIETVTFIIDGKLKHEDNHGGVGVLKPGDVQWMTAGKGIIHSEDPLPGETVHSLQLWVNLPRNKKMAEPRYQDLRSSEVPTRREQGAAVRVFSGSSSTTVSSTLNHVPVTYVELIMEAGSSITQDLPASYNGFIYILEGSGRFGSAQTPGEQNQVLWLGSSDGSNDSDRTSGRATGAATDGQSEITILADESLRAILEAGEPVREPVVAHGPFVMNTEEEIMQAFEDYHSGKFGPLPR